MELKIKPCSKNSFPLEGILIKSQDIKVWLREIQRMNISLDTIEIFPIPGDQPNTLWGSFISVSIDKIDIGKNTYCQKIGLLYISEKSILEPLVSEEEIYTLLNEKRQVFHPEFGFVELDQPINWEELISCPIELSGEFSQPESGVYIPKVVLSYQIQPVESESILEKLGVSSKEEKEEKPLDIVDKLKLSFYRKLFSDKKINGVLSGSQNRVGESSVLGKLIFSVLGKFGAKEDNVRNKLEELEERNKKRLKEFLKMFKDNPDEALKYATPLEGSMNQNSTRGALTEGNFDFFKRWFDFSLFGGNVGAGGGTSVLAEDKYTLLYNQYRKTAEEYLKNKNYQKAAFVYMRLLKEYIKAAVVLTEGKLYEEAAIVYLEYCNDKPKAAECYEKGKIIVKAIDLYKELEDYEKIGDLYTGINKKKEANIYYQKKIEELIHNKQYLKASFLYKNKKQEIQSSQRILFRGWKEQISPLECLNNYFSNIDDVNELETEIENIYTSDVDESNQTIFLKVLKYEFEKHKKLRDKIRDMAYEIIIKEIPSDISIVNRMKQFDPDNKQLSSDLFRFSLGRKYIK